MNLSQIQAECGRLLSDPNNDRWSASTLTTRINILQTEIQGYTNAVKTSEDLATVASSSAVTVNANTMDIIRAFKRLTDGSVKPFQGITIEELMFLYPDFKQWTAGEPLYWWYDGTNQTINLVPVPDATFSSISNPLTVFESRKPADLVNSTDIPFDSNNQMIPYHEAIVHGVVALCFQDDGTPEALGKSKFHRSGNMLNPGEYENWIGKIMSEFDVPVAVPSRVLYKPQGGRVGTWWFPSKSNPLPW